MRNLHRIFVIICHQTIVLELCVFHTEKKTNYESQIQIHRIKMRIALDIGTHKLVPLRVNVRKLRIAYLWVFLLCKGFLWKKMNHHDYSLIDY